MCCKALTNLQMTIDFPSYLATFKEYPLALLANQMNKVYSIQPDPKSDKSNIPPIIDAPFISFPKPSDPNPMAMDLDVVQVQFNNIN
ncbi:hypothetical protein FBU30_000185 [Linnemannia zychae]|nr:hypothetical protein FBU30_000185 [Linnemannia zychae]